MKKILLVISLLFSTLVLAEENSFAQHEAKMQQAKERSSSMGEEARALKEQNRERVHEDNRYKTKEKKENENRYGSDNSQGSQNMYEEKGSRGSNGGQRGGGRR